eukprot:CAMPEP_0115095188 /NCGR_PEP_ID=MMETSP0227-20121206/28842_1 /TAXON_ID=89957 /ORGANISM="Polarella glacialis, Strain CCMP 1383" /LENGTH=64 /DNA_ID=CAMNT_0002488409 /DNA_START=63 /DNA_END=257 /DNA_ORIENTATION=-
MFSLARDAFAVCKSMGIKPFWGMSIPCLWTFVMSSGVYFNNVRRNELSYQVNKPEGSDAAAGGH